ncbi:hypothetical protein ACIA49_28745 [Kribbella sp. NPDC051587]|uniref:hypothetical protein n=1 Tax=Kribbella sp. NPDC051587 TaxID=3364119 RepID=UPI003797BAA1
MQTSNIDIRDFTYAGAEYEADGSERSATTAWGLVARLGVGGRCSRGEGSVWGSGWVSKGFGSAYGVGGEGAFAEGEGHDAGLMAREASAR